MFSCLLRPSGCHSWVQRRTDIGNLGLGMRSDCWLLGSVSPKQQYLWAPRGHPCAGHLVGSFPLCFF